MAKSPNHTRFENEYAALLLDYAAGALPETLGLMVETHCRLNALGARRLAMAEAVGAVILEAAPEASITAAPVLPPPRLSPRPTAARRGGLHPARKAVATAIDDADFLHWRWRLPRYREHDLRLKDLRLVRLSQGAALPSHGHGANEWTLVLSGAFTDESGLYRRGDLAFAGPGDWHRPRVTGQEDCVCLAATSAPLTFASPFGRAAAWVLEQIGA